MEALDFGVPADHWEALSEPRLGLPDNAAATLRDRERIMAMCADHFAPIEAALGQRLDPSRLRRIAEIFQSPDWEQGAIRVFEALVLDQFVRAARPEAVLELGVASGVSSAVLLHSLADLHGAAAERRTRLYSYDVLPHCYFDKARPVGSAVDTMAPELRGMWSLRRGDARAAATELAGRRFDLIFIDANHSHPWPTFDLLWLSELAAPGAWVILHDVALARIYDAWDAKAGAPMKRREYGPEALLAAWPGAKVIGNGWAGNIGAIRVNEPSELTPERLRRSLERRWEVQPPPAIQEILMVRSGTVAA